MSHISWYMKASQESVKNVQGRCGSIPLTAARQVGEGPMCLCLILLTGGLITKQKLGECSDEHKNVYIIVLRICA
jgi:hypothetical protein